ncbi:hypothetical protein IJJ18_02915 [Candidatus Saccharibacteria bacterium]|nr:hypothetical protein [Candidatus Saccharibacteria bacterium]
MREDIDNYWKIFRELCESTEKYAKRLRKGQPGTSEYYILNLALVKRLDQAAGLIGLPMMGEGEKNPLLRKQLIDRETSFLLNCLFDDETREAYLAEAKKVEGEAVSMADLRLGAMASLSNTKRRKMEKEAKSINKEVKKAQETAKKAELKAEKKVEKAESKAEEAEKKAEKKTEKAWRKAAKI